jgi:selenocysteine-specific elongation factor
MNNIEEKEHIIIGTAGHVDHGKTALVKALTGIDADTLTEEKKRGMTIELGFVFMDTPGLDKQIVFIDVPGHEKFVKTMVAGASNIDAALLIIAADEGICIQTIEHFNILQFLGIKSGIIALTKADLIDKEHVDPLINKIKNFVSGTFLDKAPVIPVSAVTGAGIEEIKSALISISRDVKSRRDSGIFRMPIDRVFTIHGFGTVIAGTILSGRINIGDRIEIFPDGIISKVRGIQMHHKKTKEAYLGRRTAINLQDIKKESLRRGQCAGAPGSLTPSNRLDARLYLSKSYGKELKNRTRVKFHTGTTEINSRLVLLDRDNLIPGQTALAQFVTESPIVALPKDRFVIRSLSPVITIGGGIILDENPIRHKRFEPQILSGIEKLEGKLSEVVEQIFKKERFVPQDPVKVAVTIGEKKEEIKEIVKNLYTQKKLIKVSTGPEKKRSQSLSEKYLHQDCYHDLSKKLTTIIKEYFNKFPYRLLMPISDLQSRLTKFADKQVFETIIYHLNKEKITYQKKTGIGLTGYQIKLKPEEQKIADQILKIFKEAEFATPLEEEIRKKIKTTPLTFKNIIDTLLQNEYLVRLDEKVIYHKEYFQKVKDIVTEHIKNNQSITVAELRDILKVSRKYTLAILEYFDEIGLTKRIEDKRILK